MYAPEDREHIKDLRDYVVLFLRWKKLLLIPAALVFAAAVAVALYLPPVYRSTATILIEEPEVPPELVQSTVTSYAEERLHVIRQRALATRNVSALIEKYNLYPEMRRTQPISKLVEEFRDNMEMDTISARVIDPRSGRAGMATIAFTLSYDSPDPRLARQLVNEIVTFYLAENIRERQGQAAETNKFMQQEAERLAGRIRELEAKLASFKEENSGRLPEQASVNMDMVNRSESDLHDITRRIEILQERRILLQSQLASLDRYVVSEDGKQALSPEARLYQFRAERSQLSGIYGNGHPDVVHLNSEIAALERQTGAGVDSAAIQVELDVAREQLADARQRNSPEHPNVLQLQATVDRLSEDLAAAREQAILAVPTDTVDRSANPAYNHIAALIQAADVEVRSLQAQRKRLATKLEEYQERVVATPQIERAYRSLVRDYENAQAQYKETRDKQLSAELSQSLELENKSERFSLIEPPQVPHQPEKPNRFAIIGLGFMVALGVGGGLVLLAGFMDDGIYGARELAALIGEPPLVAVPQIASPGDVVTANAIRAAWGTLLIGGTAGGLWAIHEFVRPLDMLWYSVLQRLSL